MNNLEPLISLIIIVLIGFVIGFKKVLPENSVKVLNSYLFNIAVPFAIFLSITNINLATINNYLAFIIVNFLITATGYISLFLIFKILKYSISIRGSALFAGISGNVAFFGLPIVDKLFGQEYLAYAAIYTAVFFVAVSLIASYFLEVGVEEKKGKVANLIEIMKNPLFLSSIAGLTGVILQIAIPDIIKQPFQFIASSATPIGLFALGLFLAKNIRITNIKLSFLLSINKLIIFPVITLIVVVLLQLPEIVKDVSIIQAAMPTATFALAISDKYKLNADVSSNTIVISSVLFIMTMPIWLYIINLV